MPSTFHLYCLSHLDSNVTAKLRSTLSLVWDQFRTDFWITYRAVSPDEFGRLWKKLTSTYPAAQLYLDEELYPCRQHWAWAWVGSTFTAGVRTTGRVKCENRVNKTIGGPKKTLLQLFRGLNEHTNDQKVQDLIRQRQLARQQHVTNVETLFHPIIKIIREHAGPGKRQWDEYALEFQQERGYTWDHNEERSMINTHENDHAYISTKWLIHQIAQYTISRSYKTGDICATAAWTKASGLWLQNPKLDMASLPAITKTHQVRPEDLCMVTKPIPSLLNLAHPKDNSKIPHALMVSHPTETLPAREVFHDIQAAIRPLMTHVETREQVEDLIRSLDSIRQQTDGQRYRETIHDPPVIRHKGRPRTTRLTGAAEGRALGGGGSGSQKRQLEDRENIDPEGP
ncbi:hypothetical protein MVEN_00731200 [Mycena venus]|uniref:MULE transposase domain-containing protein n=1 Tax=Mycena venus TaxID=2733690 RepID=A0A8H6YKN3_9AGAR|nr:hypothetical protein MVEN_00731200 [Mycena venus]